VPAPRVEGAALLARWESVRTLLLLQGVPDNRARTEAARTGALEVWEMINGQRRRESAVGSTAEARILQSALRPLQDIVVLLLQNPADPARAGEAVRNARRKLNEDVKLGRPGPKGSPAAASVDQALSSLEALLTFEGRIN
jgi:hypothetical protein